MSGAEEPTTETVTGSKSNCEMLNCSSMRAVLCLEGAKVMMTSAVPSGGITPERGVTSKSGWLSITAMSYSKLMGILHDSGIFLDLVAPMATLPKSIRRGRAMSLADGYAWIGTTRFSASSPQKIFTVS